MKSDTNTTTFSIDDGYRLVRALQETISALHRHGHAEQAAVLRRATAVFTGGRTVVELGTLHRWWVILQHAYRTLAASPIDEPGIADDTADLASLIIWRELSNAGFDWRTRVHWGGSTGATAHACTRDDLNADLDLTYEILAGLPPLADPELEARVQHVAELLARLTYDTCADCYDDGVAGDDLVEGVARTVGGMMEIDISIRTGPYEMASKCSDLWFEGDMLARRSPDVFQVRARPADLAEEGMRERVISLMGNTPGLADMIQDAAAKAGVNPAMVGISLTFRRDDTATAGYANPFDNACRMRDLLVGESSFHQAA